jgi:DNA repair protein RadC
LAIVPATALTLFAPEAKQRAVQAFAADWRALIDGFAGTCRAAPRERLCAVFLGADETLISVQETPWGDHQSLLFPFRAIVGRALAQNCHRLVLAHNHPSGDPRPSRADIDVTRILSRALAPLEIVITDHVIVSRNGKFSFRAAGLL